jgi:hypothetical protein
MKDENLVKVRAILKDFWESAMLKGRLSRKPYNDGQRKRIDFYFPKLRWKINHS